MTPDPTLDDTGWIILVNDLGEHSLWPAVRPVPPGWRETGPEGDRETCLAWIDRHWTALQIPRSPTGPTGPTGHTDCTDRPDRPDRTDRTDPTNATQP